MPELPEAETLARQLQNLIAGRSLRQITVLSQRVTRDPLAQVRQQRVDRVQRYGKWVLLQVDVGWLVIRLGMTGTLRWCAPQGPYTRAILHFEHGWLCFNDIRQFGSITLRPQLPNELGPDPLEMDHRDWCSMLRSNRALKPALLDQRKLRGLGNIYTDEILFAAGLHPLIEATRLGEPQIERLERCTVEILERAIELGGSSISDFVDVYGRPGRYQFEHRIFRRAGEPCSRCGERIQRIVVAQRGTYYCPACQRL